MRRIFFKFTIFLIFMFLISTIGSIREAKAISASLVSATAKVNHLMWSLKNNYLGIKNQAQWEVYIKEARYLISIIPISEASEKAKLIDKVNTSDNLVKAIARINQVEKSMEINYHGIKNSNQWKEYIELSQVDLDKVDKNIFSSQHSSLLARKGVCEDIILSIEQVFQEEYNKSLKLYKYARDTMFLRDAEKALDSAKLLGTCKESDDLEYKCETLIRDIKTLTININSVDIKEETYDDDRKNQVLYLLINEEGISIEFLKVAGYTVEFQAKKNDGSDADIFTTGSKSDTGKLRDGLPKGRYTVVVMLSKGSNKYISSPVNIDVINLDSNVSSIEGYTIHNLGQNGIIDEGDFINNSNILVVGEKATIESLDVLIDSEVYRVSSDIEIISNDTSIIDLENGYIIAESKGVSSLTILYNGVSKKINIEVKEDERKVSTIEAKDFDIITQKNSAYNLYIKDQYGDPIDYKNIKVAIQGSYQIADAIIEYKDIGEAILNVQAGSVEGLATIHLKDNEGNLLHSIQVRVSRMDNVEKLSLDIVPYKDSSYSKDLTIFPESYDIDRYIKFQMSQYNSEGIYNGRVNLKDYSVMYDKDLLSISGLDNGVFNDVEDFIVSAKKSGESDLAVFYPNRSLAYKVRIKVQSYSNKIEGVNWKSTTDINYVGEVVNIYDMLDVVESSNDDYINGIVLSNPTSHRVRIKKSDSITINGNMSIGDLYLDKDDNGIYSTGDLILGKVHARCIDLNSNSASKDIDIYEGVTTKRGDRMVVIFYIKDFDEDLGTMGNVIENKSINIDVK
ncbi:hypothetical protein [Clostridium cylindrosporum]|uniref:S-layer protein EA1 n=1 Tax=Clostridium cylindrosporum DSM 605 TaxID=1121307 RepID=A0A0J8G5G2_CLOCY|nr:hypothetical protein [Clostridium cylindrosporum]KMT22896.1 S-layer protein EA1 [Clostridium cylindrosporum DSM 605]